MKSETKSTVGAVHCFHRYKKRFRFFVTNPNDSIMNHHVNGMFYEEEELDIIGSAYRGGQVLDIGANIGNHTVYFSKVLLSDIVIPLEPNPVANETLSINCALNACSNVDLSFLNIALGANECRLKPITPHVNNLGHTVFEGGKDDGTLCLPGDTLFLNRPISFIKLDVEGMELEILEGLADTIKRWKPTIFIEVWDDKRAEFMAWCEKNKFFVSTNYRRYKSIDNFLIYHESNVNPIS